MKKMMILLFCAICVNGIFGQVTESEENTNVLFIYEESNNNINPWKVLFENKLRDKEYIYDVIEASQVDSKDISKYDFIIIHGAVMGFTLKEPVRNWLKSKPDLSGKKVLLFVTASQWFLDRYNKQLLLLLEENNAVVVDAVSSATKSLSDKEKNNLVLNHLVNLE